MTEKKGWSATRKLAWLSHLKVDFKVQNRLLMTELGGRFELHCV
jgi:hypothetical protein